MEWISVKDRLPGTPPKDYMVFDNEVIDIYKWTGEGWIHWDGGSAYNYKISDVTHWMPLPSKPKDK